MRYWVLATSRQDHFHFWSCLSCYLSGVCMGFSFENHLKRKSNPLMGFCSCSCFLGSSWLGLSLPWFWSLSPRAAEIRNWKKPNSWFLESSAEYGPRKKGAVSFNGPRIAFLLTAFLPDYIYGWQFTTYSSSTSDDWTPITDQRWKLSQESFYSWIPAPSIILYLVCDSKNTSLQHDYLHTHPALRLRTVSFSTLFQTRSRRLFQLLCYFSKTWVIVLIRFVFRSMQSRVWINEQP